MAHDTNDYDRVKHQNNVTAFGRLREVIAEQQRRAVDPREALIRQGLQTALDASPDALRNLDVYYWSVRICQETHWESGR